MTRAHVSADIPAPGDRVWLWVNDIGRWPRWDVTFFGVAASSPNDGGQRETIDLIKAEADRTIDLTCRLTRRREAGEVVFRCTGGLASTSTRPLP
ncbi:MAG: SRPBCC family protein [Thermomicrobiales bacterium]